MGTGTASVSTPSRAINLSQVVSLLISSGALSVHSILDISLLVTLSVVAIHLGFLGFRVDMGDPKNTNVVA